MNSAPVIQRAQLFFGFTNLLQVNSRFLCGRFEIISSLMVYSTLFAGWRIFCQRLGFVFLRPAGRLTVAKVGEQFEERSG